MSFWLLVTKIPLLILALTVALSFSQFTGKGKNFTCNVVYNFHALFPVGSATVKLQKSHYYMCSHIFGTPFRCTTIGEWDLAPIILFLNASDAKWICIEKTRSTVIKTVIFGKKLFFRSRPLRAIYKSKKEHSVENNGNDRNDFVQSNYDNMNVWNKSCVKKENLITL